MNDWDQKLLDLNKDGKVDEKDAQFAFNKVGFSLLCRRDSPMLIVA